MRAGQPTMAYGHGGMKSLLGLLLVIISQTPDFILETGVDLLLPCKLAALTVERRGKCKICRVERQEAEVYQQMNTFKDL